jgi:hypothetical protein
METRSGADDANLMKKTARLAGFLYLLASIIALPALVYVPGKLFVRGDAVATANNLRASDGLLHVGIASELLSRVVFVFLVFVLYRLFKGVSNKQAALMATLLLLSIPIVFVNVLNEVAAAALAGAGFTLAFDKGQLDALAYLFLHLHHRGLALAETFWGLWLFPFAILVIRSEFIPRVLGFLLLIAGCGYLLGPINFLFLPRPLPEVALLESILAALGELPIIFWLLIWGVKRKDSASNQVDVRT